MLILHFHDSFVELMIKETFIKKFLFNVAAWFYKFLLNFTTYFFWIC